MTRTAVSPSKRLGSSGTAFAFSSSYSREESSSVSTSSMWWLSCRLQPSKPPGKTWPSRTIKGLRAFHGLFFWAEDLVVVFLLERSSSTPYLYCIQFNCVCGCVMKLCSMIQGVWTLQSQYYEEHENLPTSGGEISVSAQKIVSFQKRGTQLLWFTKYSTYCVF